jgi:hypothetical protein
MCAAEIVAGEFVISGGDAAPILEPAPHALDAVSLLVSADVVDDRAGSRCGRGDDGFDLSLGEPVAQVVCVVGFVGEQSPDRPCALDQPRGDGDVVDIAGGQDQDARSPLFVRERVELARAPAAGLAEALLECPPFPPPAERCALICVLSIAAKP